MSLKSSTDNGVFCTSGDLMKLIEKKFPQPAYTTLSEIRDGTGFMTRGQSADAMAFATWPSRGLKILGFEFKSYRGDWLRELKNPAKAETFTKYCHEWWLVTGSNGVAKLEEIPPKWGWMVGTSRGLVVIKSAVEQEPEPVNLLFFMSIMRNIATSYVPASRLEELARKKLEAFKEQAEQERESNLRYAEKELKELREAVQVFESASGITIDQWGGSKRAGEIVKAIMDSRIRWNLKSIKETAEEVQGVLDKLSQIEIFKEEIAKGERG